MVPHPPPLPRLHRRADPLHHNRQKRRKRSVGASAARGVGRGSALAGLFSFCSQGRMAGRVGSIEDIAWRGQRLRLWCFGCARSRVLDAGKVLQLFADRGWDLTLSAAALRFPCRRCLSARDVMILPARASVVPGPDPEPPAQERSWADEVAGFFHATRAARKQKPLDPALAGLLKTLSKKKGPEQRPGPQRQRIEDLD